MYSSGSTKLWAQSLAINTGTRSRPIIKLALNLRTKLKSAKMTYVVYALHDYITYYLLPDISNLLHVHYKHYYRYRHIFHKHSQKIGKALNNCSWYWGKVVCFIDHISRYVCRVFLFIEVGPQMLCIRFDFAFSWQPKPDIFLANLSLNALSQYFNCISICPKKGFVLLVECIHFILSFNTV